VNNRKKKCDATKEGGGGFGAGGKRTFRSEKKDPGVPTSKIRRGGKKLKDGKELGGKEKRKPTFIL